MSPRDIGAALLARAGEFDPRPIAITYISGYRPPVQKSPLATFVIDGLTIRCPATLEGVQACAAKFLKAPACLYAPQLPGRLSLRRPKDGDALMAALADRDYVPEGVAA